MSTYATMKDNVGNNIQDTSSAMSNIIGMYLNRRYFQVLRQINWNYINEDYDITTIVGTRDYVLPADFKKEVYCVDMTNGREISNVTIQGVAQHYPGNILTQGAVKRYSIFNSNDGNKYIRFHYVPNEIITVGLPYIVKPSAMSSDSDTPAIDISDLIELGATADSLRYKRKWQQAREWETQFRLSLDDCIWDEFNQPNKVYQFKPNTFNRDDLI